MPLNTLRRTGQPHGDWLAECRGAGCRTRPRGATFSCLRTLFAISVLVCQGDTLSALVRLSILPSSLVLSLDRILCCGFIVMVTVLPCCYFI